MKTILITGASGLVGSRLIELYKNDYQLITPEYPDFDLTKKETIEKILSESKPEVVIHLAAYTDVGKAEEERGNKDGACYQINVTGTKNLVSLIDPNKTHLIYISTDYVFSGSIEDPGPYAEDKTPETDSDKLSWYGFTKAEGERVVKNILGDEVTTLRINFPVRAKYDLKLDFLRKLLSLYDQGKLYPLFSDQQLSITDIDQMGEVLKTLIEKKMFGVYHVSTSDTASPYELISYLLEKTGRDAKRLEKTSLVEYMADNKNVRYPIKGGLKVKMTEESLGIKFLSWREVIEKLVSQGLGR